MGSFVDALHVDARGHLWVGSERGLTCLDSDGRRLAAYGEADGLPNPNVGEHHGGRVGEHLGRHLRRARPAPGSGGRAGGGRRAELRRAGRRDGPVLHPRRRVPLASRRALLRHLARAHPLPAGGLRGQPPRARGRADRPQRSGVAPSWRAARALRCPRPIHETTELVLPHDQADVSFTFAALNYILPQKNRYTHRLEGLDRDWSPVGPETSASYVRIPPGDYVFRVRACNNDGVWNMDGVSLRLRVTPPFWQTRAFAAADRPLAGGHRRAAPPGARAPRAPALSGGARREAAAVARAARHARAGARRHRAAGRLGAAAPRPPAGGGRALPGHRPAHGRLLARGDAAHGQPAPLAGARGRATSPRPCARSRASSTSGGEPLVEVEVHGTPRRLSVAAEHHLFRIAQEALTNARDARAGPPRERDDHVHAGRSSSWPCPTTGTVSRPRSRSDGFHFGLSGMRERARALGTRLEVDSAPGRGTTDPRALVGERGFAGGLARGVKRTMRSKIIDFDQEKNDVPCRRLPTPHPRSDDRGAARARGDGRDRVVHRRVEARREDRPQPVRPVRRAPRPRRLRGRLGRSRLEDPQHPRHPQRRRGRAQGAARAERALAGRLLRRRVPLAQGHRPAAGP